jgi:hypothetical protein
MSSVGFNCIPTDPGALQAGAVQNQAKERFDAIAKEDAKGNEQRGATALDAQNGGTSGTSSSSSTSSTGTDAGAIHMEKLKGDLEKAKSSPVNRDQLVQQAQAAIDAITSNSSACTSSACTSSTGTTSSDSTSSASSASTDATSSTTGWSAAGEKQLKKLEGDLKKAQEALGALIRSMSDSSSTDSSQLHDLQGKFKTAGDNVTQLRQSESSNDGTTFDFPAKSRSALW